MQPDVPDAWDVPEAWQDAAESVREHLCSLRGGTLFLSSADALQLLEWFEGGVAVSDILRALERASDARRKNRSKVPLSLRHARRHLGRPTRGVFGPRATASAGSVFEPVGWALRAAPRQGADVDGLAARLQAIEGHGAQALEQALAEVRRFLDDAWQRLGADGRAELRERARTDLGDLVHLIDETTLDALLDEGARSALRARYPCLSAASLHELIDPHAR